MGRSSCHINKSFLCADWPLQASFLIQFVGKVYPRIHFSFKVPAFAIGVQWNKQYSDRMGFLGYVGSYLMNSMVEFEEYLFFHFHQFVFTKKPYIYNIVICDNNPITCQTQPKLIKRIFSEL